MPAEISDETKRLRWWYARVSVRWWRASLVHNPRSYIRRRFFYNERGVKCWYMKRIPYKAKKKRKTLPVDRVAEIRARTKRGRDEAIARHRAETAARSPGTKRTISEVIASLTPEERAAISANEHAVEAVSKIIEAMLFRFSQ